MRLHPEPQRLLIPRSSQPADPYQRFVLRPHDVPPASSALPAEAPKPHRHVSLHRLLSRWALAAFGVFGVVDAGAYVQAYPSTVMVAPPAHSDTDASPAHMVATHQVVDDAPGVFHLPRTAAAVPQEHVSDAVQHVVAGYASPAYTLRFQPARGDLVLHIHQDVNAESDRAIEVVVESQPQKPSEDQVKSAKEAFREISGALLGLLTAPELAKVVGSVALEKGIERAWKALEEIIKRLKAKTGATVEEDKSAVSQGVKTAAPPAETPSVQDVAQGQATAPNPILARLAAHFETLSQIFGPPGSEVHLALWAIAEKLACPEQETVATLHLGPFVESSGGLWSLDPHFGSPSPMFDPWTFLLDLNRGPGQ